MSTPSRLFIPVLLALAAVQPRPAPGQTAATALLPGPQQQRRGPTEIRDGHVLAQGRLTLPASSPDTLGDGRWSVDVSVLWSNSFSWTQDVAGEQPADRRFLIDGETVTVAAEIRRGIGRDLDLGLRIPLHHRGGGSLDGFIDTWHRWLSLEDAARPLFLRDAFRVEGRTGQGGSFDWTGGDGTGLGDAEVNARWRVLDGDELSLALVGRLSLPTATGPHDSGGIGAGAQVLAALPLGRAFDLFAGAGLTAQDPGPVRGIDYVSTRGHGFAALEWRPWAPVSLVLETNAATRLVENIDRYPGVHWLVNVEGRFDLAETLRLDVGLTENLLSQQGTTDLALYFALGWRR